MFSNNMFFKYLYKLAAISGAAFALMFPCESFAESWRLTPSITLEGRYEDNIRLTTAPHDDVTGVLLRGNIGFSRLTEVSGITGRLFLDLSDYSGDEVVNDENDNVHLSLNSHYRTERTRWELLGLYIRDTTLRGVDTSEELDDDIVDDTDIDEGLVTIDIRRDRLQLTPSWVHDLNERTALRLLYRYNDVSYDKNPAVTGLFDYDQHNIGVGVFRRLSERDTINTNVGVSRFESPDNANNEVNAVSLTVGYKRSLSEVTSASVNVGANRSDQESDVSESEVDGYVLRLILDHKTETTKYRALLTHDLQPSGSGSIVEANQFKFKANHRFSKRLSGLLDMRYTKKDSVDASLSDDYEYYSVRPRLNWKMTPWWTLSGGYVYRSSKRGTNVGTAENNAVFISVRHNKSITFD